MIAQRMLRAQTIRHEPEVAEVPFKFRVAIEKQLSSWSVVCSTHVKSEESKNLLGNKDTECDEPVMARAS